MLTNEFQAECEQIAVNMRRELGLWGYEALPAVRLASHMEIDLLTPDQLGMEIREVEQALSASGWWAITVLTTPRIVIYHPKANLIQFESNIMHELAHLLCNHKPEMLGLISDHRVARRYSKIQEFEADYLSLCLQLPHVALFYARQLQMSVKQIASNFCTTEQAVEERLRNIYR